MTECQKMDAALAADPALQDPAAEAHLESCERCRWVRERFARVLIAPAVEEARPKRALFSRSMVWSAAAFAAAAGLFVLVTSSPMKMEQARVRVVSVPHAAPAPGQYEAFDRAEEMRLPMAASEEERERIRRHIASETSRLNKRALDTRNYEIGAIGARKSRTVSPGGPTEAPPGALARSEIESGIAAVRPKMLACISSYRVPGPITLEISIEPSGRVLSARATGKFAGTPPGVCVEKAVRAAKFPAFSGSPVTVDYVFEFDGRGGGGLPPLDPNAYLQNSYTPGAGSRDRTDALVAAGVTVGDKTLKLGTFTTAMRQRFAPPAENALGLHAALERTHARARGDVMALQVGLHATDRAPRPDRLNVVLVMDVSGSMADGDKLVYAKRAALDLVATLRASDRVAVVVYSDKARVLIPPGPPNRREAAARIDALVPEASTNIYDALVLGYELATGIHQPSAVTRVLLLSDGQANTGVTERDAFAVVAKDAFDQGITTTSVGVGLEYDDPLMSEVASGGRGSYHFLADPAAITDTMRREVESLSRAVASAVMVRIVLAEGVVARRVIGQPVLGAPAVAEAKQEEKMLDRRAARERGIARDRGPEDEPGLKTLVPHFYASTSHVMMLEIGLPAGQGRRKVGEVELRYKDLIRNRNAVERAELFVETTADASVAARSFDARVRRNVIAFRTGEELLAAAADVEAGRAAVAARRVAEQQALVRAAARRFEDADLGRDADLLDRYHDALSGIANAQDQEARRYVALTFRSSAHALCR